jgi:hypothetical protein
MVTLTRDFHFVGSRSATTLSAILIAIRCIAQARYVHAHFHLPLGFQNCVLPFHFCITASVVRLDFLHADFQTCVCS